MHTCRRWELGSEFSWYGASDTGTETVPWQNQAVYYGSGRDAMRALLVYGRESRGWRRLWIPSYYCQRVVAALASVGLPLKVYCDSPWDAGTIPSDLLEPGDVVLWVNYFGLRAKRHLVIPPGVGVELIEDHTHDLCGPLAWSSQADWCVASLRKTAPVPDGGVVWSPVEHELPPQVECTPTHELASLRKFAGMVIKDEYLRGRSFSKGLFRQLMTTAEAPFGRGAISGMTPWSLELFHSLPLGTFRRVRRENRLTLVRALGRVPWLSALDPASDDLSPTGAVLVVDDADRRTLLRMYLIEHQVYPAVLWPLDEAVVSGIPEGHIELSRRMLLIHCDVRYDAQDMDRAASLVLQFAGQCSAACSDFSFPPG